MALPELMGFTDAGILLAAFALLLVVLSYNVSQINSLMTFADAKAFATALSTRLVTSPNCFAYEQGISYYNSNAYSGISQNSVSVQDSVTPGVVSYSKFVDSNFLSCAQYAYFGVATDVPFSKSLIPDIAGISVTLVDTQDSTGLNGKSSITLSNFPQYRFGSSFAAEEQLFSDEAYAGEAAALVASVALNMVLASVTGGIVGGKFNINIVVAVGSNSFNSIAPQYELVYLLLSENSYTEEIPVQIQFTNAENQPTYTNSGVLYVTFLFGDNYGH